MDIKINFRKLMCNTDNNNFELACLDEVAVTEGGDDNEEGLHTSLVGAGLA